VFLIGRSPGDDTGFFPSGQIVVGVGSYANRVFNAYKIRDGIHSRTFIIND
jgi:hypothetical protein